ncbi:hypothetical protein AAG906_037664 [Vitis piasezkii]
MSKKGKGMKISGSLEEFRAEFNIPLSLDLHFVEDGEVNFTMGSPDKGKCCCQRVISSPINLIGGIDVPEGSVKSKVPIFNGAKSDSAAMNKRLLLQKYSTLPHLLLGLDLKKIKKVTSHAMAVKDDLLPIVEVARRTLMSGIPSSCLISPTWL